MKFCTWAVSLTSACKASVLRPVPAPASSPMILATTFFGAAAITAVTESDIGAFGR
jgi:hypothetical protein